MCTLVVLRRAGHRWPLIIAANRDEKRDRPSIAPGRHWPDRGHVVAGRDELAGGTWLGVNDDRVFAAVLNRTGTLGPDPELRSRGELPLEALDHATAKAAAAALGALDPRAYRPFNLIVGDAGGAFWISSLDAAGAPAMRVSEIPEGVSMLTDKELNDTASARLRRYLPRFEKAPPPDPENGDWASWRKLLADRSFDPGAGPGGAMDIDIAIDAAANFGTVSSSLVALPGGGMAKQKIRWLFAAGRPGAAPYEAVKL